jgi:SNF2 family DNA or RNA helicase
MAVTASLDPSGKHIRLEVEWRYKELCKSIPGSSWSTADQTWRIPLSWSSCLALRSTFRDDLVINQDLNGWAMHELETRIAPANNLRDLEEFVDPENEDLFPHQRAGVKFLASAKRALLADEPGLGKTAQAIRALKELNKNGEDVFPSLIVCPNTLKKNWAREFARWYPGVTTQVIKGTASQRKKQFETQADVYIINWESLRSHSRLAPYGSVALARCTSCGGHDEKVSANRCEVHIRELNEIDFKAVVADEIHRSKDPKSKQTRALWSATGDAQIRFALTGTPVANNVVDMWSILHWLSPEDWSSKTKWIDRMVDTMLNAFGGMMVLGVKPHMEEEFQKTISHHMRRMLKARVLPWLPPVINERRDIEMSAKQKKAYDQMRDHMITQLESGEALSAPSVLTQTIRLLQFASSYAEIVVDERTGEPRAVLASPSCKVDSLMDDIKSGDFGDDSVAVCAVSRQLIELLSAELTKNKIEHGLITGAQDEDERQQAIDDFQSGRIKWILFTAQAGGVGVTLTAARRLVMLQRPWSLVDHKQALDRVHRIGSEIHDSVIITDYVTEGTIEERVLQVLETKADNFEQIVHDKAKLLDLLKDDKAGKL